MCTSIHKFLVLEYYNYTKNTLKSALFKRIGPKMAEHTCTKVGACRRRTRNILKLNTRELKCLLWARRYWTPKIAKCVNEMVDAKETLA